MVVGVRVGDREAHRHAVQERGLAEVVADREDELVLAGGGLVGEPRATVVVGLARPLASRRAA